MLLDQHERARLVAYLLETATSNDGLVTQAEKMPGLEMLSKKLRTEALACRVVAKMLSGIETVSVGEDSSA